MRSSLKYLSNYTIIALVRVIETVPGKIRNVESGPDIKVRNNVTRRIPSLSRAFQTESLEKQKLRNKIRQNDRVNLTTRNNASTCAEFTLCIVSRTNDAHYPAGRAKNSSSLTNLSLR